LGDNSYFTKLQIVKQNVKFSSVMVNSDLNFINCKKSFKINFVPQQLKTWNLQFYKF